MRNQEQETSEGRLPAMAPLANPYVPFQMNNPPKYEATKALIRGTLFPGLDLPFRSMVNSREMKDTPKVQLQTLAFAIQELALYLDTHRDDAEALDLYRSYQRIYHDCMMKYTKEHGPLTHKMPSEGAYKWLDDPWPWEYCGNKEV